LACLRIGVLAYRRHGDTAIRRYGDTAIRRYGEAPERPWINSGLERVSMPSGNVRPTCVPSRSADVRPLTSVNLPNDCGREVGHHGPRLGAVLGLVLTYGVESRSTLVTALDLLGASPHQRDPKSTDQLSFADLINCWYQENEALGVLFWVV
jgi:hypothetical protein